MIFTAYSLLPSTATPAVERWLVMLATWDQLRLEGAYLHHHHQHHHIIILSYHLIIIIITSRQC